MKNILITLAVITYSLVSCVEDAKSYNCSDLNKLKSVFEKRILKTNELLTTLKYGGSSAFERKIGDSLIQLENQFDELKKNVNNETIESLSLNPKKVISKINSLPFKSLKEPFSISKIKKESIKELKAIKTNYQQKKCNSYNELKLLSIQEDLFQRYLSNSFATSYHFNKVRAHVYSGKNIIEGGDSLLIDVSFKAEDTTSINMVKYWIDDSTMASKNQINHESNDPIVLKGKKGNHKAEGYVLVKKKGIRVWKKWEFEYVVE